MTQNSFECPCGSEKIYQDCCFPVHQDKSMAKTAEQLMRARYSAYVLEEIDFIEDTQIANDEDPFDREAAEQWSANSQWLGLRIVDATVDSVAFVASYLDPEGHECHHQEKSYFFQKAGQWYFERGDVEDNRPARRSRPKTGRNDPCPCGSGRKFKKCCILA